MYMHHDDIEQAIIEYLDLFDRLEEKFEDRETVLAVMHEIMTEAHVEHLAKVVEVALEVLGHGDRVSELELSATYGQRKQLRELGVEPRAELTRSEAWKLISKLLPAVER